GDVFIIAQTLSWLYQGVQGKLIMAAVALISLGCSYYLLLSSLNLDTKTPRFVIQKNETGSIGISLEAVEQFISRTAKNIQGVKDIAVRTDDLEDGLYIQLKLILDLERKVPDFINEFQLTLHRELEETLGLKNVKEVEVLIDKVIPNEQKSRPYAKEEKSQIILKDDENTEKTPAGEEAMPREDKNAEG
ncbi:alkaline shock response membrane anchor protein AmaP, partial [bacterium]|nr:alkaline shock response membrane anchor protein AmaP [bacterium]